MYAQFALVIAATAIISAVNAVTLKPTQCALWLRPIVPPEKRNFIYRGFNFALRPRSNAGLWPPDRPHGPRQPPRRFRRPAADRCRRLRHLPDPARLPPRGGPGLPARHRPAPARRLAGPHQPRHGRGLPPRQASRWRGLGRQHRRHLRIGRQRPAGQLRRRLRHPEGLGRPSHPPRPADQPRPHRRPGRPAGLANVRARPARHPGHRQCRRLHHAAGTARRHVRLRQAASDDPERHRDRRHPIRPAAPAQLLPRQRPAIQCGGRPGEGGEHARLRR